MTAADVKTLLPLVTEFTVPGDVSFNAMYTPVVAIVDLDLPDVTGSMRNLAETYLLAWMMSGGDGKTGVTAEKIDDYSISFASGGKDGGYYAKYQMIVAAYNAGAIVDISSLDGVTREDSLDCLDLDLTGICDDDTEDEFVG